MFSLHSMVTSREVHSPLSCGLAMQMSVNSLFGDVVIVSGEVSTDRPTSVRERHTFIHRKHYIKGNGWLQRRNFNARLNYEGPSLASNNTQLVHFMVSVSSVDCGGILY